MTTALMEYSVEAGRNAPPAGFYAEHSLLRNGNPGASTSRWLVEGVDFVPTLCTALHVQQIDNYCVDFDAPGLAGGPTLQTCPGVTSFAPYVIELAVEVRMLPTVATRQTWLAERLSLGLSQMLETKVWPTSAPTNTPWLGGGTSVTPATTGAVAAVGAIEDKILAAAAGAGTIHMAPSVALAAGGLVLKDDGLGGFRTIATGSKVIVGNYPPGKVAGHIGEIDVYVGPGIYQDETFDRTNNKRYHHAWIEAAAAWHTCAAWVATVT